MEHLSAGEWERWREDDREWKRVAMGHLIDHTERLAAVEANAGRAESASAHAEQSKRLSLIGNVIGVLVNATLVAFGHSVR